MALGLPRSTPHYLRLNPPPPTDALRAQLRAQHIDFSLPLAVLHPGATKTYKLWPDAHFAEVATALVQRGYQVVLIGAGNDAKHVESILVQLPDVASARVASICNLLSLAQLASFLQEAKLMIGNDSGPFHMAAALGVRGVVIFGPTEADLWGPIAPNATLLQNRSVCRADCTRHHCEQNYRCLSAVTPEHVLQAMYKPIKRT